MITLSEPCLDAFHWLFALCNNITFLTNSYLVAILEIASMDFLLNHLLNLYLCRSLILQENTVCLS